jgi:Protein of unknown function (DUF998)
VKRSARQPMLAVCSIALFPLIAVLLQIVQSAHYSPARQAVSELALGRAGWLMMIAFCAMGLGTVLVAQTVRRDMAGARVPSLLLAIAGLLDFVSAFVHADGETGASTTHGQIHQLAGIATFVLIISCMFLLVRPLRRNPAWRGLATPTRRWGFTAVAAFVAIPVSGDAYFGVAQRGFIAISLSWVVTISVKAFRVERRIASGAAPIQPESVATSYPLGPVTRGRPASIPASRR